ncbi:DUF5677 domain-containing protein [Schumannella soli]|uniref:Uncharacterized protein n=1 Tax=Schumannella soli TaxID=2590779 RepID=A0A506Y106_9MICO|nr:DUF5677 domain-containing protein [Schumannella soli]TPW75573.1 hypothetical protein FJ657_06715 [Schumannella soli]
MAKLLFSRQLLPIFLGYFGFATVVIATLHWVGWWQLDLLKDTILVVLLVGLPLLFRAANAKDGVVLLGRTFADTLGISALVLFYVNLVSMPLVAELAIQLVVIVLSVTSVLLKYRAGGKPIARVLDVILGLIGLGMLVFTTSQLIANWSSQDLGLIARTLALSIWYPFALLPFIYATSFYSQAQLLFVMLPFFNDREPLPLRVRAAILVGLRFSTRLAGAFTGEWRARVGKLTTAQEARAVMREYRAHMKGRKRLDKELKGVLPEEAVVEVADLQAATDEEPFIRASFDLLRESVVVMVTVAGLRRDTQQENGLDRNQAILVGHFAKSIKLVKGLVRQLSDGHDGDLQLPIFREVLESIATVNYLLGDDGSGARFDSYVNDSMIAEREFKKDVDRQIAQRGRQLPIEERILSSIAASFAAAGVSEDALPSRGANGWPSAEKRVHALGPTAYSAYRMGSNVVHGAFADIEKSHLVRKGTGFEIVLDPVRFRPQPLLTIALLMNDAMLGYITAWVPEARESFSKRLMNLRKKLHDVDTWHEIYLQKDD